MKVKLGFAIATSIPAEILIVDEVLAVGDLAFQRKCFDRMEEIIRASGVRSCLSATTSGKSSGFVLGPYFWKKDE